MFTLKKELSFYRKSQKYFVFEFCGKYWIRLSDFVQWWLLMFNYFIILKAAAYTFIFENRI